MRTNRRKPMRTAKPKTIPMAELIDKIKKGNGFGPSRMPIEEPEIDSGWIGAVAVVALFVGFIVWVVL